MKSLRALFLAPIATLSIACYVSPSSSSTPSTGATTGGAAVGETPEMIESETSQALQDQGIALDQPLDDVMTAAEAADKADKSGKTKKVIAIMKAFSSSLGVQCNYCHVEKLDAKGKPIVDAKTGHPAMDFEADDKPAKSVTRHMWNDWVANFRVKETGAPVFCDSCHQNKAEFLDRDDPEALGAWMRMNFTQKLIDTDGNALKCSTCHGKPFKNAFLDEWESPDAK